MAEPRVFAVDIGGTAAKCGLVHPGGTWESCEPFATSGLASLEDFLQRLCAACGRAAAQGVDGFALASLGMFDESGLCIGGAENLAFLQGVNLPALLGARFPGAKASVVNDCMAAALAEQWLGCAQNAQNILFLALGTGVGGALILNGKLHKGSHFRSGEVGYSNYTGAGHYFERDYSTIQVLKAFAKAQGTAEQDGTAFFEGVERQAPAHLDAFEAWMEGLAGLIANNILLVDPELVVLGGGVSGAGEILIPVLAQKVEQRLPPDWRGLVRLCAAGLANNAGILGAARYFWSLPSG